MALTTLTTTLNFPYHFVAQKVPKSHHSVAELSAVLPIRCTAKSAAFLATLLQRSMLCDNGSMVSPSWPFSPA
jgi:hypothetical protein